MSVAPPLEKASPLERLTAEGTNEKIHSHHLARAMWLKRELRRTPWWGEGHLALAWVAVALGEISLAYASCHAVLKLSHDSKAILQAKQILGKTYLARGMFTDAVGILTEIVTPERYDILEDLAAAHIGAGEKGEAVTTLQQIPEEKRSMSARTALSFALGKHLS